MFTNRIALITGGGSGIGRSLCKILSNEGASLIIADQNIKGARETLAECGDQHVAVECDVTKPDSVGAAYDQAQKKWGPNETVSLVANCAGITKDGWFTKMP